MIIARPLIAACLLLLLAAPPLGAVEPSPSVDYGASCMGLYGRAKAKAGISEAVEAMEGFFARRGLRAEVTGHSGRFVRADVFRGRERVDAIILDIRTGKMRSVY